MRHLPPHPAPSSVRPLLRLSLSGLLLAALLAAGCSRPYYRRQADCEVYRAIDCASNDSRWKMDDYSIDPDPQSRMCDPYDPDAPPMPPDDPTAHRLMHCVDCKKGWPCWHCNGDTRNVESPCWMRYLPLDSDGSLALDREVAVRLGMINSRDYQTELEDLYLSALDVTYQRFRFDTQFFAGNSLFYTAEGKDYPGNNGRPSSTLDHETDVAMKRLTASGGELVVNVANSLVWQFAGPDDYTARTLMDFTFVQPLLRRGGRAVVLENLTQAERAMLANIRQMERYRQMFYVQMIHGRALAVGPVRGGLTIPNLTPAATVAAATATGVQSLSTVGVLTLMNESQNIRYQRVNVAALRDSLDLLEAVYAANRIDSFQVDQTRQALYNAQSRLVGLQKNHQDRLDALKILLGLPPQLKVRLNDPLLDRFNMIDPGVTALLASAQDYLDKLREAPETVDPAQLNVWASELQSLRTRAVEQLEIMDRDLATLRKNLPERRAAMKELAKREEFRRGDVDLSVVDVEGLDRRTATLEDDFVDASRRFRQILEDMGRLGEALPTAPLPSAALPPESTPTVARMDALAGEMVHQLEALSLLQARARLDSVVLVNVELDPDEALDIARANRLDWMNARAALVDVWRQIEVRANALKSNLNVTFSGDIATKDNNPVRFRSTTGRLRVGVEFDAPLTRLAERNLYREALIDYQRARRAYYGYEDRVSQVLRTTLRTIRLDQLNFEIRRIAVHLAINQVELARLRLIRPPRAGETSQLGPTTARDLVDALSALLNAQNDFVGTWIDYENQRLNLDLDLGTMRLDHRCMWIDPGPIRPGQSFADPIEEIPAPPPEMPLDSSSNP